MYECHLNSAFPLTKFFDNNDKCNNLCSQHRLVAFDNLHFLSASNYLSVVVSIQMLVSTVTMFPDDWRISETFGVVSLKLPEMKNGKVLI